MTGKKKKIRAQFRKKHETRARRKDVTRQYAAGGDELENAPRGERISGKGELSRKRTVVVSTGDSASPGRDVVPHVASSESVTGRVLSVHGLTCTVRTDDGRTFRCAVRQLLKSLSTDQRHVVAAGDIVTICPVGSEPGFIERVEPRRSVLSRTSRGRQHVIVANVDLVLVVASAAEPTLKPNLIDRFLVTAERNQLQPVICINKIDLVDPAALQPLVGVYGQLGYQVLLLSATSGLGIRRLRQVVLGKESVIAGQSGVGKSSLLNAIDPGLALPVLPVSEDTEKGQHTTTTALLIPLSDGGYIVDTPGIRQFQLWDVQPQELANYFRDVRSFVSLCRFPSCTHTHESDCAVKHAVADGLIDARRYESYCQMLRNEEP